MQLGFVTAILPDLSFADVLQFAAEEQFDCVEVMCWPVGKAERKFAGVTHIDVSEFTKAAADDVQALCQKHGVALSGLGILSEHPVGRCRRGTRCHGPFEKSDRRGAAIGALERQYFYRCRPSPQCGRKLRSCSARHGPS